MPRKYFNSNYESLCACVLGCDFPFKYLFDTVEFHREEKDYKDEKRKERTERLRKNKLTKRHQQKRRQRGGDDDDADEEEQDDEAGKENSKNHPSSGEEQQHQQQQRPLVVPQERASKSSTKQQQHRQPQQPKVQDTSCFELPGGWATVKQQCQSYPWAQRPLHPDCLPPHNNKKNTVAQGAQPKAKAPTRFVDFQKQKQLKEQQDA